MATLGLIPEAIHKYPQVSKMHIFVVACYYDHQVTVNDTSKYVADDIPS